MQKPQKNTKKGLQTIDRQAISEYLIFPTRCGIKESWSKGLR